MADIRIKDLTTTASTTAADDFFAADGATNGTRKLSAYSPTFGGNATVGGTLTVNGGTLTLTGAAYPRLTSNGTSGGAFQIQKNGTNYGLFYGNDTDTIVDSNTSSNIVFQTGGATRATINSSAFTISLTTASTSSSTGALVVGNGTSGGLGVGGAIWGGGKVHVGSAGYADGGAKLNVYATPSDAGYLYGIRLSDNSTATLALGLQTPTGTTSSFIHSNIALGFGTVGTAALNINTSQQVQVLTTTASTTTSSGALVVSGGVGVAGAISVNGGVGVGRYSAVSGGSARVDINGTGVSGFPQLMVSDTTGRQWEFRGVDASASFILDYWNGAGSRTNNLLTISAGGNLGVLGSVTTGAPTGGTAAAWKLGTVATVSPTSPNRTIEVDIGGTIYYIHAKTTNN
jgi:hypothetical protein